MASKPKLNADQVFEIRRYRFRAGRSLETVLPYFANWAKPGLAYQIPPNRYRESVGRLRERGLEVVTASDQADQLPYIHRTLFATSFRPIQPPDTIDRWRYLSPLHRRWLRLPSEGDSALVRDGWTLVHRLPPSSSGTPDAREYYYLESRRALSECRAANGLEAIYRTYGGLVGVRALPSWTDGPFLFAFWPGYYLPPEFRTMLFTRLIAGEELTNTEYGTLVMWYAADRPLITRILKALRLELRAWRPDDDWLKIVALALTRAYGVYLQSRSGTTAFRDIIKRRSWQDVKDDRLRVLLTKIDTEALAGNPRGAYYLNYMAEQATSVIAYDQVPNQALYGIVVDADDVEWGGQATGVNHYRVALPDLGVVVSWRTRMFDGWRNTDRAGGVIGGKWRLLPVLGRLRTNKATVLEAREVARSRRESLRRALSGIPQVEWQIARQGVMEAFSVDFDEKNWRGHNDLMRYSVCCAQVLERHPATYDAPALRMKDVLGFDFVLETTDLSRDFIPRPDQWIMFFARLSIHDLDIDVAPIFHLVVPNWLMLARPNVVERQVLAAATKYLYNPTISDLEEFFQGTTLQGRVFEVLAMLVSEGEIVRDGQLYYWRYPAVSADMMRQYVKAFDKSLLAYPYDRLHATLHPLKSELLSVTTRAAHETQSSRSRQGGTAEHD